MIKFIQSKKGFTMLELIVVIAIIGVLMAILFPLLTNERAKKREANAAATDFYSAVQYVFTRYSFYEAPISAAYDDSLGGNQWLGVLHYFDKMSGNYPFDPATYNPATDPTPPTEPETTSIFIEVHANNGKIDSTNVIVIAASRTTDYYNRAFYNLIEARADATLNSEFERLLAAELSSRISFRTGYYYAKVTFTKSMTATIPSKMEADTIKVDFALFMTDGLPTAANVTDFNNNLLFTDENKLASGDICGTCAKWNDTSGSYVGLPGTMIR